MANRDFVFVGKRWSCTIKDVPEEHPADDTRNIHEELQEFCEYMDSHPCGYDNGIDVVSQLLGMWAAALAQHDAIRGFLYAGKGN